MPEGGEKKCRNDQSDPVLFPAVPILLTDGSVRNTQSKRQNATRSMTETLLYAVDTAEHGNESVTVTLPLTLCVRSANETGSSLPLKKFITSFLCPKAEQINSKT